jgi:DNA-binding HxlR family transcriptional regulator
LRLSCIRGTLVEKTGRGDIACRKQPIATRQKPSDLQDFERSLAGISPNTLSARLKRLEDAGIVERRFYEQHPPRAEYVLTEKGKDLRRVLRALLDWGQHHTKYRATAK